MKFLKQQNINKFNVRDQRLFTDQFGKAVIDLNGGLRLPQGTTAQRPDPTKGRWPGITDTQAGYEYADGTLRYNIDTNSLECLIYGVWEVVRGPGATSISRQLLGPGDAVETVFGPLYPVAEPGTSYQASADNIIVMYGTGNLWQVAGTNFNVYQSVSGSLSGPSAPYADGWYVKFTSPPPAGADVNIYYGYAN